jgi:hypothetical protein
MPQSPLIASQDQENPKNMRNVKGYDQTTKRMNEITRGGGTSSVLFTSIPCRKYSLTSSIRPSLAASRSMTNQHFAAGSCVGSDAVPVVVK